MKKIMAVIAEKEGILKRSTTRKAPKISDSTRERIRKSDKAKAEIERLSTNIRMG
jgi:hypothetical protein